MRTEQDSFQECQQTGEEGVEGKTNADAEYIKKREEYCRWRTHTTPFR